MFNENINRYLLIAILTVVVGVGGCKDIRQDSDKTVVPKDNSREESDQGEENLMVDIQADVVSVNVNGSPGEYNFSVGVSSPDTGCEQYADWWEVITEGGKLIYRRILLHSHVNEQPFTRSGGPVSIDLDTVVIIRAHMNNAGYGGIAYQGSVGSGFQEINLGKDFARGLENQEPLPAGCNF